MSISFGNRPKDFLESPFLHGGARKKGVTVDTRFYFHRAEFCFSHSGENPTDCNRFISFCSLRKGTGKTTKNKRYEGRYVVPVFAAREPLPREEKMPMIPNIT